MAVHTGPAVLRQSDGGPWRCSLIGRSEVNRETLNHGNAMETFRSHMSWKELFPRPCRLRASRYVAVTCTLEYWCQILSIHVGRLSWKFDSKANLLQGNGLWRDTLMVRSYGTYVQYIVVQLMFPKKIYSNPK